METGATACGTGHESDMHRATQASCRGESQNGSRETPRGIHRESDFIQRFPQRCPPALDRRRPPHYLSAAMRAHRKLKAAICQVLIGLLLFAQAAFATGPCVEGGMSAAAAVAAAAAAEEHGCCETSVSEANLCVSKCTDGDEVSAHTPLLLPPVADHAVGTVPAPDDRRTYQIPLALDNAARDPPKTIRCCSFLI